MADEGDDKQKPRPKSHFFLKLDAWLRTATELTRG